MSNTEVIRDAIYATFAPGASDIISDLGARVIASDWHGGQGSDLCALATSGAIDVEGITAEISDMIRRGETGDEQWGELGYLIIYIEHHGDRGPQDGWSDLHW